MSGRVSPQRYGLIMLSRRTVLGSLAFGALPLAGSSLLSQPSDAREGPGLGAQAATRGLLYGCAASTYMLNQAGFAAALTQEARILVPEYEMKRETVERKPAQYDFSGADALLRFAHAHGMAFRGHTLVWHKANPVWLDQALASPRKEQVLTGYINAVVSRYRDQMHSWDVVNEALAPDQGRSDNLRLTPWLRTFGPSYIDLAFHAARAADPNALLVYNDWGCEAGGVENDRFRAATLEFLARTKARRVPIDAYGMQGHLAAFGTKVDQRKLGDFLNRLKSLGLRILITEHDVDDSGGTYDVAMRDRAVADASRRFLDVVLDNHAVTAVLTWGLSDRFLDPPGWKASLMGYSPRMLPLDTNFARKPMWSAIAQSLPPRLRRLSSG